MKPKDSLNHGLLKLNLCNIYLFSGSASSFSEANYKPSFLPDEELKHLVLKVNTEVIILTVVVVV